MKKENSVYTIELFAGGKPTSGEEVKYARYQYDGELRHLMKGGLPAPITTEFGDDKGGGQKNRYARAYRRAVKANALTRVKLNWWHKTLQTNYMQRFLKQTVINTLKGY